MIFYTKVLKALQSARFTTLGNLNNKRNAIIMENRSQYIAKTNTMYFSCSPN